MADVISLDEYRPHSSGEALCLDCHHTWVAVAPAGTRWMECPSCHLVRGRFKNWHQYDAPHWHCGVCDNELFYIIEGAVYCPNCGVQQRGHDA